MQTRDRGRKREKEERRRKKIKKMNMKKEEDDGWIIMGIRFEVKGRGRFSEFKKQNQPATHPTLYGYSKNNQGPHFY